MTEQARNLATIPKAADLEVRVRLLDVGGRAILEFIDYVPSLDQWGRGYWIPLAGPEDLTTLAGALASAAEDASA